MRRRGSIVTWGDFTHFIEVAFFPNVYRYLYPGEHAIYSERRHVIVVVPWLLMAMCSVLFAALVNATGPHELRIAAIPLLIVTLLFAFYHFVEWYAYRVFISDRRLVELKGLFGVQVNMMPLGKITDMAFDHTIPGLALGYGKFRVESAGQDQALGTLQFMVNENLFYAVSTALSIDRGEGLKNLAKEGYLTPATVIELFGDGLLKEDTVIPLVGMDDPGMLDYLENGEPTLELLKSMIGAGRLSTRALGDLIRKPALSRELISGLLEANLIPDELLNDHSIFRPA